VTVISSAVVVALRVTQFSSFVSFGQLLTHFHSFRPSPAQMVLPFRRRQLRQRPSTGQHAAELPLARRLVSGQAEYQSSSGNLGP